MNNSFEYLDIILLAMIAGFIILRLRGILGRRTGHKKKVFRNPFNKKVTQRDTEKKVVNYIVSKTKKETKKISVKEFKKLQEDTFNYNKEKK